MSLFERREHAHVVGDRVQLCGGLVDLRQRVRGGATHPAGVGEDVHFFATAEEHDPGGTCVQEADHAARLRVSSRSPAEPSADGFDRRPRALGGRVIHWQRYAARHRVNLALSWRAEAARESEAASTVPAELSGASADLNATNAEGSAVW
jgi:hypothetical protein